MANQSWDRFPASSRPPEALREAIADLETIAEGHPSLISRMIRLGRRFRAAFTRKDSENRGTQERLINAISVIKAHYLKSHYLEKKAKRPVIEPKVHPHVTTPSASKIASLRAPWRDVSVAVCQATPRELDLFRVKAISLIRKYVTRSHLLGEALEAIRNTPIVQAPAQDNSESGLITLTQTIRLFPDCFVLQGSFQRNAHSKVTSIPLSGSFHMMNSGHAGHPQPKLHNGWALSLHPLPKVKDYETPILRTLLSKKQHVDEALRTGGDIVHKARLLIASKERVFQQHVTEYLQLHRALAEQIAKAGGVLSLAHIEAYFAWLVTRSDAYDQISQLYEVLNEIYIGHAMNQNEWLALQKDHPATDFSACLGPILARGSSEPDTLFGRQMLHVYYQQLRRFHQEIYREMEDDVLANRMRESLIADRLCFETDPLEGVTTIPQQAVAEHLSLN